MRPCNAVMVVACRVATGTRLAVVGQVGFAALGRADKKLW